MEAVIVGCGLTGSVIARELAETGFKVTILERRNHIGGNMYDYVDDYGILVHKYGPHTFHTNKKELYDYISRFAEWDEYHLECGAVINGKCVPTPFNFESVDAFFSEQGAAAIKEHLRQRYPSSESVPVTELLFCGDPVIENYARFLFENDYSLYSAKQWGCSPDEIDPSVLKRVPIRFDYQRGYFHDAYQVMPHISYTSFFENLLDHKNIEIETNTDACSRISISETGSSVQYLGQNIRFPLVFTGALDELFGTRYGSLPYRSLKFQWKHEARNSFQEMPVVAYPQEKDVVRIIEYKKLPIQNVKGTTCEWEYSVPYQQGVQQEPYYPILTDNSIRLHEQYAALASACYGLYPCGRLGLFRYCNMDEALENALKTAEKIKKDFRI